MQYMQGDDVVHLCGRNNCDAIIYLMPNFTQERTQTSVLEDDRKEVGQQHHVLELALATILKLSMLLQYSL